MPAAASTRVTADTGELERSLGLGLRLLEAVESFVLQLSELGDIQLPPGVAGEVEQAQLRAAAPLYLASELEQALLLPATEMLAGLLVAGALPADLGPAGDAVVAFHRARHQRLAPQERRAFFARLFGAPEGPALVDGTQTDVSPNREFEPLLAALAQALLRSVTGPVAGPASEAVLRVAAQQLAANLVPRSGGMTDWVARDVLESIAQALEILKAPAVQQAVGARGVWSVVTRVAQRYLHQTPEVAAHVARAQAGLEMLTWLAEALPRLESFGAPLPPRSEPVVAAAATWLETTPSLAAEAA